MCLSLTRFALIGMVVGLLALPCRAGPWGQESGAWFSQVEITTGHLQNNDYKTDAVSAYGERGFSGGVTVSLNHYSNFLAAVRGTTEFEQYNAQDTRFAIQKRVYQNSSAALSLGLGQSQRNGFRNGQKDFSGGASYLNCPETYTDAFGSFGFQRKPAAKKKRRFRLGRTPPKNILYTVETAFDLNGADICREIRVNAAMIQQGDKGAREAHIWHTQVDESQNEEGAARLSSTKYRVLYRRNMIKRGSVYVAYTVERSERFEESSVSIGVSRSIG